MPEENRNFDRLYQFLVRFSVVGMLLGMFLLIYVVLNVLGRVENLAPAEMKLLLNVLKNRFFQ